MGSEYSTCPATSGRASAFDTSELSVLCDALCCRRTAREVSVKVSTEAVTPGTTKSGVWNSTNGGVAASVITSPAGVASSYEILMRPVGMRKFCVGSMGVGDARSHVSLR